LPIGMLADLCQMAGFSVVASKREDITSFTALMQATSDNIKGAYYCLSRDEITPADNIPTMLRRGWDFALWYAFVGASKEDLASDYMSVRRETSLVSTTGAAWNPSRQFPDLSRVTSLIRLLAKTLSIKVKYPKKFLKGEGYFLEKFVGKKPMPGLYTNDEFAVATQNWAAKQQNVRTRYKSIPDSFQNLPMKGLGAYIDGFNTANPATISTIETAKASRIPMLLTVTGRGRSATTAIAKGSSLPSKLQVINGGDSVRTIGRVLWSPLMGCTQNEFISEAMKLASELYSSKVTITQAAATYLGGWATAPQKSQDQAKQDWASIEQAAQTYLEVIPDRSGNAAWDAAFAPKG
jgi:hypothetical protein